jgi:hypothetical protein
MWHEPARDAGCAANGDGTARASCEEQLGRFSRVVVLKHSILTVLMLAALAGGISVVGQQLPSEPRRQFGAGITGAFEGWFDNPDGSRSFLLGYLNRNTTQVLDVPIGPNNHIEPGGPDLGQPTHFLTGRRYGMFVVPVPKDFKADSRLTWTITVNGQSSSIPLRLHPDYVVSPFNEIAAGNTPPAIRFVQNGPPLQGPVATVSTAVARSTAVGTTLKVTLWASDDMKYTSGTNAPQRNPPPPVRLLWSKFRGPGEVTFDKATPPVEKIADGSGAFNGLSTVSATFSEAGDYLLHVTANDYSGDGGGGFQCCWTTALVKVTVTR